MKRVAAQYKKDPSFRLAVKVFLAVFSLWMAASYTFLHFGGARLFNTPALHPVHVTLPSSTLTWAGIQTPPVNANAA